MPQKRTHAVQQTPITPQQVEDLLTVSQAMQKLGVKRTKFYQLVRDGLPAVRFGARTMRFRPTELQSWIEQREE